VSTAQVGTKERVWVNAQPRLEHIRTQSRAAHGNVAPSVMGSLLAVADVAVVAGMFLLAYVARFSDDTLPMLSADRYVRLALVEGVLAAFLLASHGLYDTEHPQSWAVRFRSIVSSSSTALVLAVTLEYFLGDQAFSRIWLASGWAGSVVMLAIWRVLAHRLYERLRGRFSLAKRVLIVGANPLGQQIAHELKGEFDVVGYVDNGSDLEPMEMPLLGSIAQLDELVHMHTVDELVIALPSSRREQVTRLLARGFRRPVQIKVLPDLADLLPERFVVHEFGGRRYIGFVPAAAVSWAKRALDLTLVSVGMLVVGPLMLLIALAVKLDSPGPIFYRQKRVGKDGHRFWMLKFRSMGQDADKRLADLKVQNEATGPLFKMRRDPRVTRVGGILRRWSLDELPQLLNVLRGDMSLVGPRPPLPSEVEQYEDWHMGRLRAMPGLTGLWQVSGRSEVPFHDMVRLDLHYIRNWSLAFDLEILLRTIPAVLTNRGAY
jgi:exopolysaccharide biosynthesis polyprenyl glycosylphosphotransferase